MRLLVSALGGGVITFALLLRIVAGKAWLAAWSILVMGEPRESMAILWWGRLAPMCWLACSVVIHYILWRWEQPVSRQGPTR